jgi:hypothetical protein
MKQLILLASLCIFAFNAHAREHHTSEAELGILTITAESETGSEKFMSEERTDKPKRKTYAHQTNKIPTQPVADFLLRIGMITDINPQPFYSPVIKLIDGTPNVEIPKMLKLVLQLHFLQHGEPRPDKRELSKQISFEGERLSVAELMEIETMYLTGRATETNQDPAAVELSPELKKALIDAKTIVERIYEPNLKQAAKFKRLLVSIIEDWKYTRREHGYLQHHSLLEDWGEQAPGTERAFFRNTITSFTTLSQFIDELKMFIIDMLTSCPRSAQAYNDALQARKS